MRSTNKRKISPKKKSNLLHLSQENQKKLENCYQVFINESGEVALLSLKGAERTKPLQPLSKEYDSLIRATYPLLCPQKKVKLYTKIPLSSSLKRKLKKIAKSKDLSNTRLIKTEPSLLLQMTWIVESLNALLQQNEPMSQKSVLSKLRRSGRIMYSKTLLKLLGQL